MSTCPPCAPAAERNRSLLGLYDSYVQLIKVLSEIFTKNASRCSLLKLRCSTTLDREVAGERPCLKFSEHRPLPLPARSLPAKFQFAALASFSHHIYNA